MIPLSAFSLFESAFFLFGSAIYSGKMSERKSLPENVDLLSPDLSAWTHFKLNSSRNCPVKWNHSRKLTNKFIVMVKIFSFAQKKKMPIFCWFAIKLHAVLFRFNQKILYALMFSFCMQIVRFLLTEVIWVYISCH